MNGQSRWEAYRKTFECELERFLFCSSERSVDSSDTLESGLEESKVREILRAAQNHTDLPWSDSVLALREGMAYVRLAGGKRVRPVLVYAVWDALPHERKKENERSQLAPLALAIEGIHTYSLVHDDLPCMDDDAMRRGIPTLHTQFGEGRALLVGDALLTEAACLLTALFHTWPQTAMRAQTVVLQRALSMVQGQWRDLSHVGNLLQEEELLRQSYEKTACLLQAPVLAVAALYDVSEKEWESCAEWSKALGLAFQIRDDLLDQEASAQILGKTPGKDLKQNKATFVTCLGKKRAYALLQEQSERALQSLAKLEDNGWDCSFLREWTTALQVREE